MASLTLEGSIGYDLEFVEELREDHKCPICLLAMRNPVQTKCGHHFCNDCLLNSFRVRDSEWLCPQDRTFLPRDVGFFSDQYMKRNILSLHVKCKKHDKGCYWTGELRAYKEHKTTTCQYVSVVCNDCHQIMERRHLDTHKASECVERITDCAYCHEQFPFRILEGHQNVLCPEFPLDCQQKCGMQGIPRKEMAAHLKNDCPWTMVACPYAICGCPVQEYRCKIGPHLQDTNEHLFTACKELHMLKEVASGYGPLQQRVAKLEEEKESMKSSLEKCKQEIHELKATEKEKRKELSQMKTQLAKVRREQTKSKSLKERVKEIQDRFQAVGPSKTAPKVKKRKAEDKTPCRPTRRKKISKVLVYDSSSSDD